MNAVAARASATDSLALAARAFARLHRDAPAYVATAVLLVALALPTFVAHALDARLIDDVGVWKKPLKFQLALVVYCLTLAFYARFVPPAVRGTRRWRLFTGIVVGAILAEMIWLIVAANVAERAHFNFTHPVLGPVYPLMGLLAAILTAATAQHARAIHRHAPRELSPAIRGGIVWGLGLTLPLTLVTAFYLSAGLGHHVAPDAVGTIVGTGGSDAGGLALFGWSREGGDLRVAHFFATHALHGVPLLALALAAAGWRGAGAGRVAALAWTSLVVFAFLEALGGRPFLGAIG